MSNTLMATLGALVPLRGLLRKFKSAAIPVPGAVASPTTNTRDLPAIQVAERASCIRPRACARTRSRADIPLRVVRVMEAGPAAAHAGRMIISGRIADVCAELERMAERETAFRFQRP